MSEKVEGGRWDGEPGAFLCSLIFLLGPRHVELCSERLKKDQQLCRKGTGRSANGSGKMPSPRNYADNYPFIWHQQGR